MSCGPAGNWFSFCFGNLKVTLTGTEVDVVTLTGSVSIAFSVFPSLYLTVAFKIASEAVLV